MKSERPITTEFENYRLSVIAEMERLADESTQRMEAVYRDKVRRLRAYRKQFKHGAKI